MNRNVVCALFVIALFCGTWVVAEDNWQPVQPSVSPTARTGHSVVEIDGNIYIFGGQSTARTEMELNDLWLFNQNSEYVEEKPITSPPPARKGHTAVAYNGKMYVFFGENDQGLLDDVWSYDPKDKRWMQQPGSGTFTPEGRSFHRALVYDNSIWICGGKGENGLALRDLWQYKPDEGLWSKKAYFPIGSRYSHSFFASSEDKLIIYGGTNGSVLRSDMWAYRILHDEWILLEPQGNKPVTRHSQASAWQLDSLWISGGTNENGQDLQDTWVYNYANNMWVAKNAAPAAHTMAEAVMLKSQRADETNIFMFGGQRNGQAINETMLYGDGEPVIIKNEIVNQIGALGRGRFSLLVMRYEKEQQDVNVNLQWAEDKAMLSLFHLRIPCLAHKLHPILKYKNRWHHFSLRNMRHFHKVWKKPSKIRGRKQIAIKLNKVKRGYLVFLVYHWFFSKTARDIELKVSELKEMPRKVVYVFPVGDPQKKNTQQLNFVKLPVTPERWHAKYPPHSNGEQKIQTGENFWQWSYLDRNKKLKLLPAYISIDLP